jgi:hypothetical protein
MDAYSRPGLRSPNLARLPFARTGKGRGMKNVELYGRVRYVRSQTRMDASLTKAW